MGASSSRRLGWLRKMCLAVEQRCLISSSVNCTCFVVFPCLAPNNLFITSSTTLSSIKMTKNPSDSDYRMRLRVFCYRPPVLMITTSPINRRREERERIEFCEGWEDGDLDGIGFNWSTRAARVNRKRRLCLLTKLQKKKIKI